MNKNWLTYLVNSKNMLAPFSWMTALHILVCSPSTLRWMMLYGLEWLSVHSCTLMHVNSLNFLTSSCVLRLDDREDVSKILTATTKYNLGLWWGHRLLVSFLSNNVISYVDKSKMLLNIFCVKNALQHCQFSTNMDHNIWVINRPSNCTNVKLLLLEKRKEGRGTLWS